MREGWQTKTLADVCEIRPPKSEARERVGADALVSFVPMEDLGVDRKSLNATQVKPLASVIGSYTYFADGDVLLAKITPCFENGKLGIAAGLSNGVGFGSSEFIVLRPSADLDKDYLYYFLLQPSFRSEGAARMGGAVGQQRVSKEFIESYLIPLPPLPEQRRIVGILDEAFEGIAAAKANAEKNLRNARALFSSELQAVFGQPASAWNRRTLQQVAVCFGRGRSRHRPRNAPHLYGGRYPFVQTGDIRNADHVVTEFTRTYNEDGLAQSKLWPKGTVCITIAANIAETAILGLDACFPDSVIGLVVNPDEADAGFVQYVLQSHKERLQALGKGSAQDNINMATFESERFPFPPVGQQREIVARLDRLRGEAGRLVSTYGRKLAALEELRKSLLNQAFSGEL